MSKSDLVSEDVSGFGGEERLQLRVSELEKGLDETYKELEKARKKICELRESMRGAVWGIESFLENPYRSTENEMLASIYRLKLALGWRDYGKAGRDRTMSRNEVITGLSVKSDSLSFEAVKLVEDLEYELSKTTKYLEQVKAIAELKEEECYQKKRQR